jgi:hypothetical protein
VVPYFFVSSDKLEWIADETRFLTATRRQHVEVSRIIAEIDAQISKLQQARELLSGTTTASAGKGRGRPKGSKNAKTAAASVTRKRKLSPEGRKRIAEAMKRRWAERRKTAAKASSAK